MTFRQLKLTVNNNYLTRLSLIIAITLAAFAVFHPDKANAQVKPDSKNTTDSSELKISLKHGDEKEKATEKQLRRLLATYDVSKWIYTKSIIIDSDDNIVSHSHPVLTLDTGGSKDDELVLSTFVHEQFHWFLLTKPKELEEAMNQLKVLYPKVPVGYPEGAISEESSYNHLLVCYLEYQADKTLFGELKAWEMMNYLTHSHYRWIYRTVLEQGDKIASVIRKNQLTPSGL